MVDENVKPKETPKILTKPLPQILDELEASSKRAGLLNLAIRDAVAAIEKRLSGKP
jgi:hypothetical protein